MTTGFNNGAIVVDDAATSRTDLGVPSTADVSAITPGYASFTSASNLTLNNPGGGSNTAALVMDIALTGAATQVSMPPLNGSPYAIGMAYVIRNTGSNTLNIFDNDGNPLVQNFFANQYAILQILNKSTTAGVFGTRQVGSIARQDASSVAITGGTVTNLTSLTVSRLGGGLTAVASVTNTANTASSDALVATAAGGSSGGDAYFKSTVTSATDWTFGLDNSDSDAFVFSKNAALGTTNVMRISTAGQITQPLQPAFLAYNATSRNNVTGDGTAYTIPYDGEIYDQNNNFDITNGTFTAPVTGRYSFKTATILSNLTASYTGCVYQIVTSNRTYQLFACNAGTARDGNGNLIVNAAIDADMDAADTATITISVSGSTRTVNVAATLYDTVFSGFLIC